VIQAFSSLQSDKDFQEIVAYLRDASNKMASDSCFTRDEVQTRWYQGGCQAIQEVLERCSSAQELRKKL